MLRSSTRWASSASDPSVAFSVAKPLELGGEGNAEAMRFWNEHARPPIRARGAEEIRQFLTGLDLVDPGLVSCALWRPDVPAAAIPHYGVAAIKPGRLPA